MRQHLEAGGPYGVEIARGRLETGKAPLRAEVSTLFVGQGLTLDVVVEGEPPASSQQAGAPLEQHRAPRDMTPGIEADNDVERGRGELHGVNVAKAELHEIADLEVARASHGLRMADGGDVHAEHPAAELLRQVARRTALSTPDVQHGCPGRDAGPLSERLDLVCREQALLPDMAFTVHQGGHRRSTAPHGVIELANFRRMSA